MLILYKPAGADAMTKEDALKRALEHNPSIQLSLARIEIAMGEKIQASLIPNPEAVFEIENFGGSGELSGIDGAEATVGLEQQIELAGKRAKRTRIADYDAKIAEEQAIADILQLLSQTEIAFINVAIQQERLTLANNRVSLAQKTHKTVKERVSAAAASDIQHTKIDIEKSAAELELAKARKDLSNAKHRLAALLNTKDDVQVDMVLDNLPILPERNILLDAVKKMPQMRINQFLKMQAQSQLDLAKANAIPDPVIGLGLRRFNESDNTAFVAGISISLPVFNRNQGEILKARSQITEAEASVQQQELEIREVSLNAWESLISIYNAAEMYQSRMIPDAERAYNQALEGYSAGRFSFLDMLDAQRTLYEVEENRLDSLLNLYEAKGRTDFLMNTHLPLVHNFVKGKTQ
jgi:cobalt-zinc-cadmium efflux system outer membrane protein